MKQRLTVKLNDKGAIELPIDVRAVFGEARPAVKMTMLGKTYRNRVAVYGGKYFLGIWKAVLAEEKLEPGDTIDLVLEADATPRTVKAPKPLADAMKKNAQARAGWNAMSFTHKREWAEAIEGAKKPETRDRRVAQAIVALVAAGKKKAAKRRA